MLRVALLALIVAALFATLHAAPEPGSAGSRAPPASSQTGAASQKAKQAAADKQQAATASAPPPAAASAPAAAATASAPAAAATASAPAAAPTPAPAVSNYTPFAAGSTEFSLMQQIRGNLNGFDCDALVSDMTNNPAFAAVTRFNLAESKLSDACAAKVFSLLKKMPLLEHVNCHRCAVASAGAAALARYLASGTTKVNFVDLIWNDLADADIQAIADALDNVPHYVMLHTDHNPKCAAANHILRECKNHKAEANRLAAAHEAQRAAEAAREAEKRAEQIRAAAAAVKQQQKADKSAAGTL